MEKGEKGYNYDTVEVVKNKSSITIKEFLELNSGNDLNNLKSIVETKDNWAKWRLRLRESITDNFNDKIIDKLNTWTKVNIIDSKIYSKTINWIERDFVKVSVNWEEGFLPREYLIINKDSNKKEEIKEKIKTKKTKSTNGSFNYKEPQRDNEWYLKARTDLKSGNEIRDWIWYSSIKDLFTKLNSIEETQIEPLFKPQYYGEVDKMTNKKIPTYIIVGDMHADEYNIDWVEEDIKIIMDLSKVSYWKEILTETNKEWSDAEIDSLSIISNKFNIKNIWLENVANNTKGEEYWISNWLEKKWIKYIWLEKEKLISNTSDNEIKAMMLELKTYEKLGVNLKWENFTKKEFIEYYNKNKESILKLDSTDLWEVSFEKILKEQKLDYTRLTKLNKNELKNEYKFSKYIYLKMFWENFFNPMLEYTINNYNSLDKNQLIKEKSELGEYNYNNTIVKRNTAWINFISNNMSDDKMAVMTYWKAHIYDLIKQINTKYDWKVNIYVAK